MSFPDGQPRPDETPSEEEFSPLPEDPQPETPLADAAEAVEVAEDSQEQPYAAPYGSGPYPTSHQEPTQQPYAAPYGSPVDPASMTAAQEAAYEAAQRQPFDAPQATEAPAATQAPYGAQAPYGTQAPYGAPQAPYGAPQAPYGAPQAPYGAMPGAAVKPMSVMAIIALVLAILGLLISWIPLINVLGWILLLPALVLGIIAIVKTGPNGAARGRGLAIAATIVTVLALILTIAFQALYASIFSKVGTDLETLEKELKQIEQQNTPGLPNLELPTDADSGVAVEGEGDVDNGNYRIKLVSVTKTGMDYEDRPTAVLTYELTNQRNDDNYSIFDVHMQAFQNGVELENAVYGTEAPEGYDPLSLTAELKPGATKTVVIGFVLKDPSAPVLIEAEGFFSDGKVYKEFPIQ